MENKEMLLKLNKFTRREMSEDEVYIFDVLLCDNEIDRDGERFSLKSLEKLKELFVGKTGIFDHNPQTSGQTARIFDTELVTDNSRLTADGESYTYLKGNAYMVRTGENNALICEIDGGIKKEVSVSCSARVRKCSVCGVNLNEKKCVHTLGKSYNGKTAHVILDDITDAYEWSFVAVPAQVNAGVTKKYGNKTENDEMFEKLCKSIKADIYRLCLSSNSAYSKTISAAAEKMSAEELLEFKSLLEKEFKFGAVSQLEMKENSLNEFKLEGK